MNQKDPRVIKTLREIDNALLENIEKYPFQKITIDMICKSALINRSTFYKYYLDKYDLLDKYLERVLTEFKEQVQVDFILAPADSISDDIYIMLFEKLIKYISAHKREYQILWRGAIERQVYNEMTLIIHDNILLKLIEQLDNNSDPKRAAYCDLYAYIFSSNMMTLIHWWFMNENTVTEQDVIEIMSRNMREGLFLAFKNSV